jgi:hypothetical protein
MRARAMLRLAQPPSPLLRSALVWKAPSQLCESVSAMETQVLCQETTCKVPANSSTTTQLGDSLRSAVRSSRTLLRLSVRLLGAGPLGIGKSVDTMSRSRAGRTGREVAGLLAQLSPS